MRETKVNKVYGHLENSEQRFIVEQGGTRSGKTYNILKWIALSYCQKYTGKTITISRKTSPALRGSAMRDFFEILEELNMYKKSDHNKTEWEYKLNGNTIEFVAIDDEQKIRGRKRHLAFLNEANELDYDDFFQINMRTEERIIIDYNPSDAYHWIYDKIVPDPNCDFFVTTYKDNPFLPQAQVDEIEKLMQTDEQYWCIYGLGERATLTGLIFPGFSTIDRLPSDAEFNGYGLDFGYTNDPTALIAVYSRGDELYFQEKFYERKMQFDDICERLLEFDIRYRDVIFADQAEPRGVDFIRDRGFKIDGVKKGRDSVRAGIDLLKQKKLFVTESSPNLIKEFKMYKWKTDRNTGKELQEPIDAWNHGIDAVRYWALGNLRRRHYGKYRFA